MCLFHDLFMVPHIRLGLREQVQYFQLSGWLLRSELPFSSEVWVQFPPMLTSDWLKVGCLRVKSRKFPSLQTQPTQCFPCGSAGKEPACNVGDLGLIPGLGRSPGEGKGYPLQCSGLEISMDYTVHGVAKSRTWLNDFHFKPQKGNFSGEIQRWARALSHSGVHSV